MPGAALARPSSAALRARLRADADRQRRPSTHPEREHWSERLVLIADELASNALRHGGAPVAAALSRADDAVAGLGQRLLPRRAADARPGSRPGLGGFGLYLVADLSAAHGWCRGARREDGLGRRRAAGRRTEDSSPDSDSRVTCRHHVARRADGHGHRRRPPAPSTGTTPPQTFESTEPGLGRRRRRLPGARRGRRRARPSSAPAPAAAQWAALGFDGRRQRLAAWRGYLARRMHELADLVHRENGKPHADAILEITLAIDHLAWAGGARRARSSGRAGCSAGMLAANHAAYLEYQPLGVVGVIGPVELPGVHADGLDRLRAGRRQRRRLQALGVHPRRRRVAGRRLAGRRPRRRRRLPGGHRLRRDRARRCAGPASTSSPSPARRPPARRSWPPARRTSCRCSWSSAARTR